MTTNKNILAYVMMISMLLPISISAQRMAHHSASAHRSTFNTSSRSHNIGSRNTVNRNVSHTTNRTVRTSSVRRTNNVHIGHTGHTNIHVNVHRDFRVVGSPRRYTRSPYSYGGRHYYSHHRYYYHPYHAYRWNNWNPWGTVIVALARTAVVIAVVNDEHKKEEYNYENGNYYLKTEDGFVAVPPPVGAQVTSIPSDAISVEVGDGTNYYYGGGYYQKNKDGYVVVPATAGTLVPYLPSGGDETKIGEQTYVVFGDVYYQPIQIEGKDMYEIVEIK